MTEVTEHFLTLWHRIVAERDLVALRGILASDVKLAPPPYWATLDGIDLVHHLLGLVITTIEDFTYRREWTQGGELALEFTGHIGALELQGIDLITLNSEGKVCGIDVLVRPEPAIAALREVIAPQMAVYLKERAEAAAAEVKP